MNPVWQAIAIFLIRHRIVILLILALLTSLMWWNRGTEISHKLNEVIPMADEEMQSYLRFKEEFGEDGNIMVVGVEGDFTRLDLFNGIYDLVEKLKTVKGVDDVLGLTHILNLELDQENESFSLSPLVKQKPTQQKELDSLMQIMQDLPFYSGLLTDDDGKTTLLAISITDSMLNSDQKTVVYDRITVHTDRFEKEFKVPLRYAGMPVIRVNVHKTISVELVLFLGIALAVLALTLLFFFRSLYTVIFPILVVLVVIIWTLGFLGLFGFKISLVTGVIPPLVTVISIPNCVYLITKYHIEYRLSRKKIKALSMVIEKIGVVTIMTNATTAVGLGVLAFTNVQPLKEFGIIAGLSVISAFFISLILIPVMFSFLPPPTNRQTRHLDRRTLSFGINLIDKLVRENRPAIYVVSILLAATSIYGMLKILPIAYVVDDIPKNSQLIKDMRYMEERYNGVLPFEIVIDTKRKNGVQRLSNLRKIDELQDSLDTYPELSRSVSATDFTKFLRQAFMGGDSAQYKLPTRGEFNIIRSYLVNTPITEERVAKNLTDSLFQKTRVTATVRDIGSMKMDILLDSLRTTVAKIFDSERYQVTITGTTPIFIRGNKYLINNLLTSLAIAFVVIAFIMGLLFRSFRMVVISLVPNILPLIMVAGLMGFFQIPLKPSTALIFGVAFGIAVDDSIHFLARYRLARKAGDDVRQAVSNSYRDTGISMIYTSIILFLGFITFTFSSFGGTQALGLLTSLTLGIAMFSNLILLPALLISFDRN
ncbi:MAG: MMPL family transporter [Bacteroidota bacterium]